MRWFITLVLSISWIGSLHAEATKFYSKSADKYWSVIGVVRPGQVTCAGFINKKDGSFIELDRSLVDGEVWSIIHNTAWEMDPQGGSTLRWNFFRPNNSLIDGADLKYRVKDKNTILVLAITEKWFFDAISNSSYFTLVMPGNLQNFTIPFENKGSSVIALLRECVQQNEANYKNAAPPPAPTPGPSANTAPKGGASNAPVTQLNFRGTCQNLVIDGEDRTVRCLPMLVNYSIAGTPGIAIGFAAGESGKTDTIIYFRSNGQGQIENGALRQPIDRMMLIIGGATQNIDAKGSCLFPNPSAPVVVQCEARTANSTYAARFLTDGTKPTTPTKN